MSFKEKNSFEERLSESNKIRLKYPKRIPIIVEKSNKCELNDIDKNKYLAPDNININQFIYIIRKRINLDSSQSLFILIENRLCPSNSPLSVIYDDYKNEDGFLYVTYTSENTFG